mgnify:CR=1 FL=1
MKIILLIILLPITAFAEMPWNVQPSNQSQNIYSNISKHPKDYRPNVNIYNEDTHVYTNYDTTTGIVTDSTGRVCYNDGYNIQCN